MLDYRTVKMIDGDDWDSQVLALLLPCQSQSITLLYGQEITSTATAQQQNYGMRGLVEITVPPDDLDDFPNDTLEESEYDMVGVSFKAWLEKDYDDCSEDEDSDFWEREFYPNLSMVINDLYERGLLEAGEYEIDIDW